MQFQSLFLLLPLRSLLDLSMTSLCYEKFPREAAKSDHRQARESREGNDTFHGFQGAQKGREELFRKDTGFRPNNPAGMTKLGVPRLFIVFRYKGVPKGHEVLSRKDLVGCALLSPPLSE
jgi:hypothetical protein